MYTNVIETDIAGAGSITDLVIYITNPGKEGIFKYNAFIPYIPNDATLLAAGNSGSYERVFDSVVDIKWFGAVSNTNSTAAIQAAIDFILTNIAGGKNYNLYLSRGTYDIDVIGAGTDALTIDTSLTDFKRMIIYGDGEGETILRYVGADSTHTVLRINNQFFTSVHIKDLSIKTDNDNIKKGMGIYFGRSIESSITNVRFDDLHTGLFLEGVNAAYFNSLAFHGNEYCVNGAFIDGSITPPNLIKFSSCYFSSTPSNSTTNAFKYLAAHGVHNLEFSSCLFYEVGNMNLPDPDAGYYPGGILCQFTGDNGSNGLNVTNCYFENTRGVADVHIINQYYFKGTQTFRGNTFNRLSNTYYTTNNILFDGVIATLPHPTIGNNNIKFFFAANGFLNSTSGVGGNYVPSSSRRTIQLNHYNNQYWECDIVDMGNTFTSDIDKPSYYSNPTKVVTPQMSDFNRISAFARCTVDTEVNTITILSSYNVESITRYGTNPGSFFITFANPIDYNGRQPVTLITSLYQPLVPCVLDESANYIAFKMVDLSSIETDGSFSILVM